mmetsp:Transcript_3019/g.7367  ORF Transcript_3019/g.7367 Transcript_3019/m.7367 type:complete len:209 (-) Transcript_3019:422-1048(-)
MRQRGGGGLGTGRVEIRGNANACLSRLTSHVGCRAARSAIRPHYGPRGGGYDSRSNPTEPSTSAGLKSKKRAVRGLTSATAAFRSASVSVSDDPQLVLHLGPTTLNFTLHAEDAHRLIDALKRIIEVFKEKENMTRPKRLDDVKLRIESGQEGGISLDLYCNPNAHPTAFQAKALLTVRSGTLKVASEVQLSGLKADLEEYARKYIKK